MTRQGVDGFIGLFDEGVVARDLGVVFLLPFAAAVIHHAVFWAHHLGHIAGFPRGGLRHLPDPRGIGGRHGGIPQPPPGDHFRGDARALFVEMNPVGCERFAVLGVGFACGGKEIDEKRPVGLGDLLGHPAVGFDLAVAGLQIHPRAGLHGHRREQDQLGVGMQPPDFAQINLPVFFELLNPGLSGECLVVAEPEYHGFNRPLCQQRFEMFGVTFRPEPVPNFVPSPSQTAHPQPRFGLGELEVGFQVAAFHEPFHEGAAVEQNAG